jgi:uncharacterized SAM-dependent methyltransferase
MNYESEYNEEQQQKVNNYLKERKILSIEFREEDIEITLDDGSLIEGEIDIDFILSEIEDEEEKEKNRERI